AYGLGISAISEAVADLAAGFCVFQLREAAAADLARRTGKRILALGPSESRDADDYLDCGVTPTVTTIDAAKTLRRAMPALSVDTGMQRFACSAGEIDDIVRAGDCREIFTHATHMAQVARLCELSAAHDVPRHAAASALLHEEGACLDAVRPGMALYENAVTISAPLVEVHTSHGPAGYSGFIAPRHGVIMAGYAHGLRKGPCLINGERRSILEVGMQSAYVEIGAQDRAGDDVILLSADLPAPEISADWGCGPHEVLTALANAATRRYRY
ncbi:MAG TPA: alanine racemase, partial [Hyphomicrobium sp.]|nr:alanine racemase [Hyphomicrobium sp.]